MTPMDDAEAKQRARDALLAKFVSGLNLQRGKTSGARLWPGVTPQRLGGYWLLPWGTI
jgi:hypothetical protein